MAASLTPRRVEKPWGRRRLPEPFDDPSDGERAIGEIIFDSDPASELLVKFLFTSEKLSIQVHPGGVAARAAGHERGKDEAWIVLDALPEATIGLGLVRPLSRVGLRTAALDGSVETLVDWRPVTAGQAYYSPAGTIHAIGPGLALLEIQQNLDLTYRLYDYGRSRELHLEEAIAVAETGPAPPAQIPIEIGPGRTRLAGGPAFQVERLSGATSGRLSAPDGKEIWLVALAGRASLDGSDVKPGEVWRADGGSDLRLGDGASIVIAYPGSATASLWKPNHAGLEPPRPAS